uniref:Uncharacterized protein n=1 Tax=Stomoxys calcitrans TaxID=35570 RepID=A0A1I8NX23_STOCA
MYKFMTICLCALMTLAVALAKPHLLTTGISYATPAVAPVAPVAAVAAPFATSVLASPGYYPAYTAPYYASYATYPYSYWGAPYFVRR